MKLYKLTDQNGQTHNNTQWGPGVTHETNGSEYGLCGPGWLHAYEHPLLAVLHNPAHGSFVNPQLWEAEGEGELLRDGYIKLGCTKLTTIRQIPLPEVTQVQRQAYAILCAKQVYDDPTWNQWADAWLAGTDRTVDSNSTAYYAACNASLRCTSFDRPRFGAVINATYGAWNNLANMERTNLEFEIDTSVSDSSAVAACSAARFKPELDLLGLAKQAMEYQ